MQKFSFMQKYLVCVFFIIILTALPLLSHPSTEWDEGVYITTWKLVAHGFPLYKETYHSQLPGFFILTYPLFILLGKTFAAARLSIFFWSIVGLLGVTWIGFEIDSTLFTIITIALLYLIPVYTTEILTFHADALSIVFSTLAFASILRFTNTKKNIWLYFSAALLSIHLLIKFDLSVIPALTFLFFSFANTYKKIAQNIKAVFIASIISISGSLILCLPFGLQNIFANSIQLRFHAASVFPAEYTKVFSLLFTSQKILGVFLILAFLSTAYFFAQKKLTKVTSALFIWTLSTLVLLVVYRPLLEHHLVFLSMPVALLFSNILIMFCKSIKPITRDFFILSIVSIIFFAKIFVISCRSSFPQNASQQIALNAIYHNINMSEKIITDDGLLSAVSDRLPPPELADISYVRIRAGQLTADQFEKIIAKSHPKLVITWAYKLTALPKFHQIMKKEKYKAIYAKNGQEIYLRTNGY